MSKKRMSADKRKEQILKIAMKLFSKKGFSGTKTKEIAEKCGINEAMIFRYFKRKEDLYSHIINNHIHYEDDSQCFPVDLFEGIDDKKLFKAIALNLIEENIKDPDFIRLLTFSVLENHKLSEIFFKNHASRMFDGLSKYIDKRIKDGAFRNVNSKIVAQGFIGMIINYIIGQNIFKNEVFKAYSNEKVTDTFADIFWEGLKK